LRSKFLDKQMSCTYLFGLGGMSSAMANLPFLDDTINNCLATLFQLHCIRCVEWGGHDNNYVEEDMKWTNQVGFYYYYYYYYYCYS
jgi:hypothetical protein